MIIKAGTYRFNDVLNPVNESGSYYIEVPIDFECAGIPISSMIIDESYYAGSTNQDLATFDLIYYSSYLDISVTVYKFNNNENIKTWIDFAQFGVEGNGQTHTITKDTEVDDTLGIWYIANTNYNEVNATPLATIEYNGETIAQLNAGDKATIPCSQYKVSKDLVIKVNEGASGETNIPYAEGVKF